MCVGSPTAGAWSSFQRRPDDEFETDRRRVVFEVYHPNHMQGGELRVADLDGYCLLVGQIGE